MAIDDNTSYELTGYQVKDLAQKIRAKADSNSLASVATSGLYSDLTGAPTIPTVYNGTLTIQQNGTTLGTFSANQDTNETINITGGGSSVTTFYWAQPSGASEFSLYKDYPYTQIATPTDVNTAIRNGALVIKDSEGLPLSDNVYYHAVSWDDDEGFLSVLSSDVFTSAPVRIGFFYNSSLNKWERSSVELQEKLTAGTGINIDANNVISATGGGGTSATIFYLDDDFGLAPHIYTDSGRTTYATATDINNAVDAGPVIISDGSYCAEITAFDKTGGMANTGQWEFVYSPDVYVFSFVDNTNIVWDTLAYQPKLTAGSNITISGDTISATDTTYSNFTGATSSTAGAAGLVPAPAAGDEAKALHGDGTWKDTTAKLVEMSYGESNAWAKFIAAYNAGSIVYCRASSNANPASGSQTRKAFMAYVNNAASPTSVEFQYVRSVSSKTESQPVDQVFVYTLTNASGGTWTVASRNMAPKIVAGNGINVSYSNGTYTISLASAEGQGGTSD